MFDQIVAFGKKGEIENQDLGKIVRGALVQHIQLWLGGTVVTRMQST